MPPLSGHNNSSGGSRGGSNEGSGRKRLRDDAVAGTAASDQQQPRFSFASRSEEPTGTETQPGELYSDVPPHPLPLPPPATPVPSAENKARVSELEQALEEARSEGRVWAKQRAVLVANLAVVIKTARAEVARKDAEIARLRKTVAEAAKRGKA